MSVQYNTHTETVDTDQGGSLSVPVPTGLSAGDIWLVLIVGDFNASPSTTFTATSMTKIGSEFVGSPDGYPKCCAFYKVAGASESAESISYTGTDYDVVHYSIRLTESGGDDIELDATGTPNTPNDANFTVDAPDITIAEDGSLAIGFAGLEGNETGITAPSGMTGQDDRVGSGLYPACAFATEAVNAGSYTPGNWTFAAQQADKFAQTISFKPVAAAGGGTILPLLNQYYG